MSHISIYGAGVAPVTNGASCRVLTPATLANNVLAFGPKLNSAIGAAAHNCRGASTSFKSKLVYVDELPKANLHDAVGYAVAMFGDFDWYQIRGYVWNPSGIGGYLIPGATYDYDTSSGPSGAYCGPTIGAWWFYNLRQTVAAYGGSTPYPPDDTWYVRLALMQCAVSTPIINASTDKDYDIWSVSLAQTVPTPNFPIGDQEGNPTVYFGQWQSPLADNPECITPQVVMSDDNAKTQDATITGGTAFHFEPDETEPNNFPATLVDWQASDYPAIGRLTYLRRV